MTPLFHPFVLDDVRTAAGGYERVSPLMASAFLEEVSARLGRILEDPEGFPLCTPGTSFRRAKLWRFPQSIIYRVDHDAVYVSLIAQVLTEATAPKTEDTARPKAALRPPRDVKMPLQEAAAVP